MNTSRWAAAFSLGLKWCAIVFPATIAFVLPLRDIGDPEIYKTYYAEIGALILLALFWIERVAGNKPVYLHPLFWPLAALVLWGGFSVLWAIHPLSVERAVLKWATAAAIFFVISNIVRESKDARRMIAILFLSGFLLACLGFLQHTFDVNWVGRPPSRPAATFGNKNLLMHYLVLVFPLGLGWFLYAENRLTKVFLVLAISVMGGVYYFSFTRAAFVATGIQLLIFGYLIWRPAWCKSERHTKKYVVSASVVVALFIALQMRIPPADISAVRTLGAPVASKVEGLNFSRSQAGVYNAGDSIDRRLIIWRDTLVMIKNHLLIGVGAGNWYMYFPKYAPELAGDNRLHALLHAHNFYLEFFASMGVVGIVLLGWAAVSFYRLVISIRRGNLSEGWLGASIVLGVVGGAINAFFSFSFELMTPLVIMACYFGMLAGLDEKTSWVFGGGHRSNNIVIAALALVSISLLVPLSKFNTAEYREEDHYYAAMLMSLRKNWNAALAHGQRALKIQPSSSRAYRYVVLALIARQRLEEAEIYARRWFAREPYTYEIYSFLIYILPRRGKHAEALRIAQKGLELRPKDENLLRNTLLLAEQMKEPELVDNIKTRLLENLNTR